MAISQIGSSLSSQPTGFSGDFIRSFTVGAGTDKLLLVAEQSEGATPVESVTVTYNGLALSLANSSNNTFTDEFAKIWYLIDPPETTADVVISYNSGNSANKAMGVAALAGVHQTTPIGSITQETGAGTSASRDISTTVDESIVVDSLMIEVNGNPAPGANQIGVETESRGASSYEPSGTAPESLTMSWTWSGSSQYAYALAEVIPAAGGVEPNNLLLLLHARGDN